MNTADIIIILILGALVVMAALTIRKNRGGCSCCPGSKACGYCPKRTH
ncbi:MAG: hypothetical protein IJM79_07915 [Erysipelotrichaceae bacterium]|nr:hypothetical protein [Erysipelotrichaceae bacterium]